MTERHKKILTTLFHGGSIARAGIQFRLRDKNAIPVQTFYAATFRIFMRVLRKQNNLFVIDLTVIRSLHGNHWAKRYYKTLKKPV